MNSQTITKNKELAKRFFDAAFINCDAETSRSMITDEYVQHNPFVPSGALGFIELLPVLREQDMRFTNHRLLADENYIVSHNAVENVPVTGHQNVVTFDVWRVEDGKLAEHWDNVTEHSTHKSPSGHTQVDGGKDIVDLDMTESNKTFVLDFVNTVLVNEMYSRFADYVSSDVCQHSMNVGDGLESWKASLTSGAERVSYDKVHLSVAEGNFVFSISEGSIGGRATSFYDLFRVNDREIVEHWDVLEEVPEQWAHGNGKF